MNTNATERIIRLNTEHDLYFEIVGGVQKPITRSAALTAIKDTTAMSQQGSWATFAIKAVA